MTNTLSTVIGVFDTREAADRAVAELRAAGFADPHIGIGSRPAGTDERLSGPPTWENGAGIGGLSGAALGGLAAGPPGMVAGGLVGLLLGVLIDLGIPEQDARWYSDEAAAGRVVITVRADGRRAEAEGILRRHGAEGGPPSHYRTEDG